MFDFSVSPKNRFITAARHGTILPIAEVKQRVVVTVCSKKGMYSSYRGETKVEAFQKLLDDKQSLYNQLSAAPQYYLTKEARDDLEELEEWFGKLKDL